jgi:hypothetical protein
VLIDAGIVAAAMVLLGGENAALESVGEYTKSFWVE